jgi:hypothetical protein
LQQYGRVHHVASLSGPFLKYGHVFVGRYREEIPPSPPLEKGGTAGPRSDPPSAKGGRGDLALLGNCPDRFLALVRNRISATDHLVFRFPDTVAHSCTLRIARTLHVRESKQETLSIPGRITSRLSRFLEPRGIRDRISATGHSVTGVVGRFRWSSTGTGGLSQQERFVRSLASMLP